ncbi:MAG: hypothetical protein RIQ94_1208 [Pseudomonadota bacterium]|jgi:hypothetical protein
MKLILLAGVVLVITGCASHESYEPDIQTEIRLRQEEQARIDKKEQARIEQARIELEKTETKMRENDEKEINAKQLKIRKDYSEELDNRLEPIKSYQGKRSLLDTAFLRVNNALLLYKIGRREATLRKYVISCQENKIEMELINRKIEALGGGKMEKIKVIDCGAEPEQPSFDY